MKKYILIVALFTIGCKQNTKDQPANTVQIQTDQTEFQKSHQYNEGDVVYLKPDSTEAVITDILENWYHVDYRDKSGTLQQYNIYDSGIYGKK